MSHKFSCWTKQYCKLKFSIGQYTTKKKLWTRMCTYECSLQTFRKTLLANHFIWKITKSFFSLFSLRSFVIYNFSTEENCYLWLNYRNYGGFWLWLIILLNFPIFYVCWSSFQLTDRNSIDSNKPIREKLNFHENLTKLIQGTIEKLRLRGKGSKIWCRYMVLW